MDYCKGDFCWCFVVSEHAANHDLKDRKPLMAQLLACSSDLRKFSDFELGISLDFYELSLLPEGLHLNLAVSFMAEK